ncbi:MAG: hypothetical protein QOH47_2398 [Sphingomonadales bacterium]|jgi:hypothetical protein|nr:hypothetical protein [Sphingomonadales bacterium]
MSRGLGSPLATVIGPTRRLDPEETRRAAQAAWQHHGIALIRPEWLACAGDRQQLVVLAERVHGERKAAAV